MDDDSLFSLALEVDAPTSRPGPPQLAKPLARASLVDRSNALPSSRPGVIPITRPPPSTSTSLAAARASQSSRITPFQQRTTTTNPSGPPAARGYADMGQGSFIQKHSGLRIKNPLVSSSQLQARLANLSLLRLSNVRTRYKSFGAKDAWAAIAMVGEKSVTQQDSHGRPYSTFKLTDLEQTSISIFLFGQAHSDLRDDLTPGTMLALLGPSVRDERGQFSLSADRADRVLVLGSAADFGFCEAKVKKTGEPCRMPVNVSKCPYCIHHVGAQYKKLAPMRIELQGNALKSAFQGGMRSRLQWEVGKFQSYDDATRPQMAAASQAKLQEAAAAAAGKGSASGARYLRTVANPTAAVAAAKEAEVASLRRNKLDKKSAPIPMARAPTVVYQQQGQDNSTVRRARDFKRKQADAKGPNASKRPKPVETGAEEPRAGQDGGEGEEGDILLEDDDIFAAEDDEGGGDGDALQQSARADPKRQAAVEIMQSSVRDGRGGGLGNSSSGGGDSGVSRSKPAAAVPTFLQGPLLKEKKTAEEAERRQRLQNGEVEVEEERNVQRRAADTRHVPRGSLAHNLPPARRPAATATASTAPNPLAAGKRKVSGKAAAPPPPSAFAAAFGSVVADMEATAQHGSLYKDVVEDEEAERLFATMDVLERKDEMAAKMDSVKTMTVSAWKCEDCGCTTEYRPKSCGEQHPRSLVRIQAVKRWWQCGGCKGRFATVGVRYPSGRCPKCDVPGVDFTGVSMLRPVKQLEHEKQAGAVAGREMLVSRGAEQKWVNG